MGMIPETEKSHSDYIDMLIDGCRKPVKVTDEQGNEQIELQLNTKKLDYKTQLVSAQNFSRFVLELENFANMSIDCPNFMPNKRAKVMGDQILRLVEAFGYSIDAKSSETLRDKNNSQSSLTHILTRNKSEKVVSLKEDAKKSLWEGISGKEKRQAAEQD